MDLWKTYEDVDNGIVYFGNEENERMVPVHSTQLEGQPSPVMAEVNGEKYNLHFDTSDSEPMEMVAVEGPSESAGGFCWDDAPTRLFFEAYRDLKPFVGKRASLKNQKALFAAIRDKLIERGFPVTELQVTNRYKTLERTAKALNKNAGPNATGRARKVVRYETEILDMFGKRHNIIPKYLSTKDGTVRQEETLANVVTNRNENVEEVFLPTTPPPPPPPSTPCQVTPGKRQGATATVLNELKNEVRAQTEAMKVYSERRISSLERLEVLQAAQLDEQRKYREDMLTERRERNELLKKQLELLQKITNKLCQ